MNQPLQVPYTANTALTHNNALSNLSTLNACLDFFAQGGSLRNQSPHYIHRLFASAWQEDPQRSLQIMAWIYDCRGGCGERDVFFHLFVWLTQNYLTVACANLALIPEFGRWDMLVRLLAISELQEAILALIGRQLHEDCQRMAEKLSISLCAKWLPRAGKHDRDKAKLIRKFLGLSASEYRKLLASLSRYLQVVEQKMCAQQWQEINYANVPSKATTIYRRAFSRHDPQGYQQYLDRVAAGKADIKASQLYPYDIVRIYLSDRPADQTLELQWQALPNPFEQGQLQAILPVVDVSGSMYASIKIRPIDVAISLGIFFAEKNPSIWRGNFLTFSATPSWEKLHGETLFEKVQNLRRISWGYNTDIQAVFDLILQRSQQEELTDADLPKIILIISDLEFDNAQSEQTNFAAIEAKFQAAGYTRPVLVFWNVDAKSEQFPVTKESDHVILLSGFSPHAFNALMKGEIINPIEAMMATIEQEKYQRWQAVVRDTPPFNDEASSDFVN